MPIRAVAVSLLVAFLPGFLAHAQQSPQVPALSERTFVTAIDLIVDVRDRSGNTPTDLRAEDFYVVEEGVERSVIGLNYLVPEDPS
ncbi:MAG TPA: hypothetical protein VM557_04925, partial [Thermoanaerobaculia bacterium]|nr:hypothetical protein [Thermoanaerobaculia bacterium]